MEMLEAVLAVTDNLAHENATRTVIQKLCYFLKVNNIIDAQFRPHYYGPYSDEVQESLSFLVGLGFIDEIAEKFETSFSPWGWRKYTYSIMEDGRIILEKLMNNSEYTKTKEIIEKCRKFSDLNINILAAAAKIHYILERRKKEMYASQISEEATKLGWEISPQDTRKAVDLLEALNFARRSE